LKVKQWTNREFITVLHRNGFHFDRWNGSHSIYVNIEGNHISVPKSMSAPVIRRLIKENNLNISL